MILTTEQFWCPTHGRQPQDMCDVVFYDAHGNGPYIPFYQVRCTLCGKPGKFVCSGDTKACRVVGETCAFHQCSIR